MKSIYFIFSLSILISACSKKNAVKVAEAPVVQAQKSAMNENPIKAIESASSLPDCLENANDIKLMTDQEGTILMVANELMISYGTSGRMNPCNLPEGFNEGDQVVFTGVTKEAPKGVRIAGTPFKLTYISKK